jgi:SM-20-related protein
LLCFIVAFFPLRAIFPLLKWRFSSQYQDAFLGQGNRILSLVTYLNKKWVNSDVGELVLFTGDEYNTPIIITL